MSVQAPPPSVVKDKNYDLITVLQMSLDHTWRLDQYIQDAEREGDRELADWFRKIQHSNMKAGDRGKAMLAQRLMREAG